MTSSSKVGKYCKGRDLDSSHQRSLQWVKVPFCRGTSLCPSEVCIRLKNKKKCGNATDSEKVATQKEEKKNKKLWSIKKKKKKNGNDLQVWNIPGWVFKLEVFYYFDFKWNPLFKVSHSRGFVNQQVHLIGCDQLLAADMGKMLGGGKCYS